MTFNQPEKSVPRDREGGHTFPLIRVVGSGGRFSMVVPLSRDIFRLLKGKKEFWKETAQDFPSNI